MGEENNNSNDINNCTTIFQVGKIEHMILVDNSVSKLQKEMTAGQEDEFEKYRFETMPVLGHYDKKNKLAVVSVCYSKSLPKICC